MDAYEKLANWKCSRPAVTPFLPQDEEPPPDKSFYVAVANQLGCHFSGGLVAPTHGTNTSEEADTACGVRCMPTVPALRVGSSSAPTSHPQHEVETPLSTETACGARCVPTASDAEESAVPGTSTFCQSIWSEEVLSQPVDEPSLDACGVRCMPTSTDAHLADRDSVPAQPPDDSREQLSELYELALETLQAHICGSPVPE